MRADILARIKEKVHALPGVPGVYKMLDEYGNIIYIGKAKNLKNRVSSYFLNTLKLPKVQKMVDNVYDFEYIITLSELEALNLESNLIHEHQPFYNILLKDGKAFPYIRIDLNQEYPTIEVTRRIKAKDNAMYFGPYFNKVNITDLMKIINSSFKIRDCKISLMRPSKRECLNYHIGNCLAPCTRKCSVEEYRAEVDKVIAFLKGDLSIARKILEDKMKVYAEMEMFERAIEMRDRLDLITNIDARNVTGLSRDIDIDVFGLVESGETSVVTVASIRGSKMIGVNNYNVIDASMSSEELVTNFITQYYISQKIVPKNIVCEYSSDELIEWLKGYSGHNINIYSGKREPYNRLLDMACQNGREFLNKSLEKNKLYELKTIGAMRTLQKTLGLSRLPRRIEGYDISNLGGTNTVASMVVFTGGCKDSKMYRKFKIDLPGQNDFRNMHDVLTRRINEYNKGTDISFGQKPDLILIDGGPQQLEFAYSSLRDAGWDVDIISLAKKQEEIYLVDGNKVVLSRDNFGLKLLQNVRDESHRFAITFNKNLRLKVAQKSELESIPLVSKNKVNILFAKFKKLDNIKSATIEELMSVKGIGKVVAENIYKHYHQ
ncbi:MAG: excinuclease ABC subunit UvrC [Clostridiales bacterium]|nr:excinuclease ABC subunit UvrC [Clostridiales bacterium]